MLYYRCKCGKREAWGSMPPPQCAICPECKSDLALSKDSHSEPKPHEFEETDVQTDEGVKKLSRCRWCDKTRKQIQEMEL